MRYWWGSQWYGFSTTREAIEAFFDRKRVQAVQSSDWEEYDRLIDLQEDLIRFFNFYDLNYEEAKTDGYNHGRDDGFDDGYAEGYDEAEKDFESKKEDILEEAKSEVKHAIIQLLRNM